MIETNEDESLETLCFKQELCKCLHNINQHFDGVCYALDHIGNIWKACACNKLKIYKFEISIPIKDDVICPTT